MHSIIRAEAKKTVELNYIYLRIQALILCHEPTYTQPNVLPMCEQILKTQFKEKHYCSLDITILLFQSLTFINTQPKYILQYIKDESA